MPASCSLTALEGQRRYDPAGLLVGLRKFVIGHLALSGFVVGRSLMGTGDQTQVIRATACVRVTGITPGEGSCALLMR